MIEESQKFPGSRLARRDPERERHLDLRGEDEEKFPGSQRTLKKPRLRDLSLED
jgi:hypothetical protein